MTKTYSESSSFTANALVIRRAAHTDIPFSREIANLLEIEGHFTERDRERGSRKMDIAPFFEARYLMTDRLLKKGRFRQVVELAAGFSPRGIDMTRHPMINFLEVDLATESDHKRRLVEKLVANGTIPPRPNLHLVQGNVVDVLTFSKINALLLDEPVAIVCEGLLRYVSFPDKEVLARHIRRLLLQHGGSWITPDIELADHELKSPEQRQRYADMAKTGMDLVPNLFTNREHAVSFFQKLGFQVGCHPLADVAGELVSPQRLGFGASAVARALEDRETFVITV